MDIAGYRLRDHQVACAGPMTVHRAEVLGRPGRLVRLTWLTGDAAGPGSEAIVDRWRKVPHPALLPITSSERDTAGLLLCGPMASARPLGQLDPGTSQLTIATLAHIGASIAAGLHALHEHGLVHGVVNSHTILLRTDGTAVLDGPWHAGCVPTRERPDTAAAPGSAGPVATEVDDVRALAVTLLDHLGAVEREEPSPGVRLRELLANQRDQPGSAATLERRLVRWQESVPEPAVGRGPAVPAPSATRRVRGAALAVVAIVGVLLLGIADASMRSGQAPDGSVAALSGRPAEPSAPTHRPARPELIAATTRPVCPDVIAPPGPGRLVLADLDGRGCRAPVRVDGSRLALTSGDGRSLEVELDLEVGDQIRIGDLDGSGRDEVLVYRPGTGELFRFDGLAGAGEERVATGETTRWRGGTAVLITSLDGSDRLEVRDGTPT